MYNRIRYLLLERISKLDLVMANLLEKIIDFLERKLRTRKWKIQAFKLCERCEKFYSFNPNACPCKRPHSTHCPLFVEVEKDKKDAFLRDVSAELATKPRRPESKSAKKAEYLRDRIKKESKYISWGWKFCPRCGSTDWELAYYDRVRCKNCGRIFT